MQHLTASAKFDFDVSKRFRNLKSDRLEFSILHDSDDSTFVERVHVRTRMLNRMLDRKSVHGVLKTRQVLWFCCRPSAVYLTSIAVP